MIDRLRLRYGMFWPTHRPPVPWREVLAVAGVLAAYGLADHIDQLGDRAVGAERAAEIYESSHRVLRDCENGAAGYHYADGRVYACGGKL